MIVTKINSVSKLACSSKMAGLSIFFLVARVVLRAHGRRVESSLTSRVSRVPRLFSDVSCVAKDPQWHQYRCTCTCTDFYVTFFRIFTPEVSSLRQTRSVIKHESSRVLSPAFVFRRVVYSLSVLVKDPVARVTSAAHCLPVLTTVTT